MYGYSWTQNITEARTKRIETGNTGPIEVRIRGQYWTLKWNITYHIGNIYSLQIVLWCWWIIFASTAESSVVHFVHNIALQHLFLEKHTWLRTGSLLRESKTGQRSPVSVQDDPDGCYGAVNHPWSPSFRVLGLCQLCTHATKRRPFSFRYDL